MNRLDHKRANKVIRKNRVRSVVSGTTERPRLSVHISNRHVSAQIIDDSTGNTLVSATTVQSKAAENSLTEQCTFVGTEIAKKAVKAKITKVVMDRNGRAYQARLNALATAARENGLEF
ncbi:MAG: 50S ribosomal protein L18 [Candidatus Saccharimonadales bacterium]